MIDITWAGRIPPHWEVVPLKSKFSFGKGLSITKADLVDTGCSVLSYGQIHSKNNAKTGIVCELLRFVPRQTAAIEKLEEYRKSIIYQAVTGKFDCRKEAM